MLKLSLLLLLFFTLAVFECNAMCPMLSSVGNGRGMEMPKGHPKVHAMPNTGSKYYNDGEVPDYEKIAEDLKAFFRVEQSFWPSDYHHYGPLFVRLAWHCSGSYRTSDGRGGCDGGRQRFDPERSWPDNTNLDKARKLLQPIKLKYPSISWGDLFILAGTTAVQDMGGPILGFCGGRQDDDDGFWSQELGPTLEQEKYAPCPVNGKCKSPLGSTTVGLIYLNPEGPMAQPIPNASALEVRDTFGRMAMNDSETVALIGGGHAFGKTHGACPLGAGLPPKDDPLNPWPGKCGDGKLTNAYTSGIEGPWTENPTSWDNSYFTNLLDYDWSVGKGPGAKFQWHVSKGKSPRAPSADGKGFQNIQMMTSDISLISDPIYLKIVQKYANDSKAFDKAFASAWYKLTTRDMGPHSRCLGKNVPPPQDFQYPLPATPEKLANFSEVERVLKDMFEEEDLPLFVRLAWQSASTFRVTDFLGGANGARIRFSPQKDWPQNKGLQEAIKKLEKVKNQYDAEGALSWADLIVLAANAALDKAGAGEMPFCGGRTDASSGEGSRYLKPKLEGKFNETDYDFRQSMLLLGLDDKEVVALMGGHSLGSMHESTSGFTGSWTNSPHALNNEYFKNLILEDWEPYKVRATGRTQYKAKGKELYALRTDLTLLSDPSYLSIAQTYAADNEYFLQEFSKAWTKIMNADRFDGPTSNVCSARL